MEIFVTTFSALAGKEDVVSEFYTKMQPEYEAAKGFQSRQVFRAKPGTMLNALRKVMSEEDIAKHPEPEDDGSIHFVIVEKWDSIEDRMAFSASQNKARNAELFPNLKPEHTHEYYDDLLSDDLLSG